MVEERARDGKQKHNEMLVLQATQEEIHAIHLEDLDQENDENCCYFLVLERIDMFKDSKKVFPSKELHIQDHQLSEGLIGASKIWSFKCPLMQKKCE